jgi:hypothetical protein
MASGRQRLAGLGSCRLASGRAALRALLAGCDNWNLCARRGAQYVHGFDLS